MKRGLLSTYSSGDSCCRGRDGRRAGRGRARGGSCCMVDGCWVMIMAVDRQVAVDGADMRVQG